MLVTMPPFSAATALEQVRAGTPLQALADRRSLEDIVAAVRDAKAGLRYGLAGLDDDAQRRTFPGEAWSIAMLVGHALAWDAAAHQVARSLALGRQPAGIALPYDTPGDAGATSEQLLAGIAEAEARLAEASVLAAGGPTFTHRDLGPLSARGWVLAVAVHDAAHLHQAAAIARARR